MGHGCEIEVVGGFVQRQRESGSALSPRKSQREISKHYGTTHKEGALACSNKEMKRRNAKPLAIHWFFFGRRVVAWTVRWLGPYSKQPLPFNY